MSLKHPDGEQFFRLHRTLMLFVDQRLNVLRRQVATVEEFATLAPPLRLEVRDAFLAHRDLLETFVEENPAGLPADELDIVAAWRNMVAERFYVIRELKKHTVYLSMTEPAIAYGAVPLALPFDVLTGRPLPVAVMGALLPFKGTIFSDGLFRTHLATFGPGIRRSLNERFQEAKLRHGLVTSLPMPGLVTSLPTPAAPIAIAPKSVESKSVESKSVESKSVRSKSTRSKSKSARAEPAATLSPKEITDKALQLLFELIDPFCREHLNEEYAVLCRKLAEKLARKRPSPLRGNMNAWASGIVRAIGSVNFLHDKKRTPYMRSTDIDYYLGTSPSSGAAKLAAIRKMVKLYHFDPAWTLPSLLESSPLTWMLELNGFTIDVRYAPREIQELAFKKGLIPYIPADRQHD